MNNTLNQNEKDFLAVINQVSYELKINALINSELDRPLYDNDRVLNLLNIKDMLLTSILGRMK